MSALVQELNGFSVRITQAIQADDWEKLSEVLTQRQARLEQLANKSLSAEEQEVLKSVQAMDKLFVDSVLSKKMELLKDLQNVAQGQKGIRAYYATATN
jgi:hypothetical protein